MSRLQRIHSEMGEAEIEELIGKPAVSFITSHLLPAVHCRKVWSWNNCLVMIGFDLEGMVVEKEISDTRSAQFHAKLKEWMS